LSDTSFLSIDIGPDSTRAFLFDAPDGTYRMLGSGKADTTLGAGQDVREGVYEALRILGRESGVSLLTETKEIVLIAPDQERNCKAALTFSAGKPLRTALVAISELYSLAALRKLADPFDTKIVREVHLQDNLNSSAQLERLITSDADLFLIAGGTNDGAVKPLRSAIENVRVVYQNQPRGIKPQILFSGNAAMADYAASQLDAGDDFHASGNILPQIGQEELQVAWKAMLGAFRRLRRYETPGLSALEEALNAQMIPSSLARSRIVRLLDKTNPDSKGVLALEVQHGRVSVQGSRQNSYFSSHTPYRITREMFEKVRYWCSQEVDLENVAAYLQTKENYPNFSPVSIEDQAIEQAWTKVRLQQTLQDCLALNPDFGFSPEQGLTGGYEPVILSGDGLGEDQNLFHTLINALDGLQPLGITTLVLDHHQVLAALGALAELEPLLPVQVIDGGILENLGTVVCADSPDRPGRKVMTVEMDLGASEREHITVLKSELKRIELPRGQRTRLYLSPRPNCDIGMGETGLGGWVTVSEAAVGLVIDGRGRPVRLPADDKRRSEMLESWQWEVNE